MTSISIKMDETLKKEFQQTCLELGLDMTSAITVFAKKVTREKRIPFELSIDPFYSSRNMERVDKSIENLEAGHGIEHELIED